MSEHQHKVLYESSTKYLEDFTNGTPSLADVAEQKLHLSLDELIEQQQQIEGRISSINLYSQSFQQPIRRKSKLKRSRDGSSLRSKSHIAKSDRDQLFKSQHQGVTTRVRPFTTMASEPVEGMMLRFAQRRSKSSQAFDKNSMNGNLNSFSPHLQADDGLIYSHVPHVFKNSQDTLIRRETTSGGISTSDLGDIAIAKIEILYPPPSSQSLDTNTNDALIVKFKGTEVLKVKSIKGDIALDSGGWKTVSTRLVLNCALKPIGLSISTTSSGKQVNNHSTKLMTDVKEANDFTSSNEWIITDGKAYLATFQDGMVIGQISGRTHAQLMARASVIAQHLKQEKSSAMV